MTFRAELVVVEVFWWKCRCKLCCFSLMLSLSFHLLPFIAISKIAHINRRNNIMCFDRDILLKAGKLLGNNFELAAHAKRKHTYMYKCTRVPVWMLEAIAKLNIYMNIVVFRKGDSVQCKQNRIRKKKRAQRRRMSRLVSEIVWKRNDSNETQIE